MNVNKWKRLLSLMLTLCMTLSWNVPAYAAEDARVTQCPAGQHEFTKAIIDDDYHAPDCLNAGFGKFECAKCGYFDFSEPQCLQEIPALGHQLRKEIVKPAGCTTAGQERMKCGREGCDYAGEITTIPANGQHNFATVEEKVAEPTCTEAAQYGYPCQNEGCEEVKDKRPGTDPADAKLDHDYSTGSEYETIQAATCTEKGSKAKKCARDGCDAVDEENSEELELDPTNHGDHETQAEATPSIPATCISYAKYVVTCTGCNQQAGTQDDTEGGKDPNNHANLAGVEEQTKAPTCGEGGYTYQICPDCNEEVIKAGSETDPDPTQHNFPTSGDKVHVSDATCHTPAKKGYVCPNCNKANPDSLENEDPEGALNPANHEFGEEKTIAATCTENAKIVKQCQYCDPKTDPTAYVVVKDLWTGVPEADRKPEHQAGHKWTDIPRLEPTCGTPGREAGVQCEVCQEWKDGEPTVLPADATKHVPGENPTDTTREATCAKSGLAKYKCQTCGKSFYKALPAGHKYPENGTVKVTATCQRPGLAEFTCERYNADPATNKCDLDDAERTKTEEIEQLQHDMRESTEESDGYKAATCVAGGVDVQKCATCGLIETTATTATGRHDPQPNTIIPSTECGVKPQIGTLCTVCLDYVGEGQSDLHEMTEQEMTDHNVQYFAEHNMIADTANSSEATCTEDGVAAQKCGNAGCEHTTQTVIPAAHTFAQGSDGAVIYTSNQPNCLEDGYYTADCTVCDQTITLTAEQATTAGLAAIPAKAAHDNIQDMAEVKPTCKADGNTAGTKCVTCNTIITGEVIPASDQYHVIDKEDINSYEVIREANCETGATGMSKQTCKACQNVSYVPIQPEHTWDEANKVVEVEADCVTGGRESVSCTVCGAKETIDTDPLGHDWDRGSTDIADGGKPASCGVTGIKVFTCSRENCPVGTKTETVEALTHNWGEGQETTPATCGTTGVKTFTCSNCSDTKTEAIERLDTHGIAAFGFIEANCQHGTQIGLYCQTCGQSVNNASGSPVVMDFTADTTVQDVIAFYSANATDSGYDNTTPGDVTDDTITAEFGNWTAAEATDHNWLETVTLEPTCETPGKKDRVCKVCDFDEPNVTIPADGHDLKEDPKNSVEPSCGNGGVGKIAYMCANCDYTEEDPVDVGPIPHDEEKTVVKEVSCTVNGLNKYVCKDCNATRTEIVPFGHDWDAGTTQGDAALGLKDATCTEGGKVLYTCQRGGCGQTKTETTAALGHDWGTVSIIEKTCVAYAKVGKECSRCDAASEDSVEIKADSDIDALITLLLPSLDDPNDTTDLRTQLTNIKNDAEPTGHSYGPDDAPTENPDADSVAATCTKKGLNKYTCSNCGYVLKLETAMLEHELEKVYNAPTCAKGGYLAVSCSNCTTEFDDEMIEGDDALPHDFDTVEKPLTETGSISDICTEGGTLVKTCKNEACGHTVVEEAIPAQHAYALQNITDQATGKLMAIIKVCTRDETHVDSTPVFVATGYGYCPTDKLQKLGEEDVVPGEPATCEEAGFTEMKKCPVCTNVIQESKPIPAKGHTEPTEWTHTKPATCGEAGLDEWKCLECDKALKTQTVPMLTTHSYQEALEPATCKDPERYVNRCTVCKKLDPDYTIIEVNPADPSLHDFNEEGTCNNCGTDLPEGWQKCAICNKWTEFVDDPATAEDATCVKPAQINRKCKTCNTPDPNGPYDVEGSAADPYAHNFNAQDTCTLCTKTAADLTDPENEAYLPLLAKCDTHGWVKGVVIPGTDSTCTVAGKEDSLKCPKCETENIIGGGQNRPLAEHTWTDKYQLDEDNMPTCEEAGSKHKVCDVCNNPFGDPIQVEASDEYHDFQADTVPPTCTTGEMVTEVCSVCGDPNPDFPGEEVGEPDPYGHKFDAETEICEYCNKTGTELSAEAGQERLGKCTTHGWQKGLSVAEVPSTCETPGTAAGYRCPVCAEAGTTTMIRGGEALPLADHTPSTNYETITEPTCQEPGVKKMLCDVCEQPFGEDVPMEIIDHNYVEVSSAPTCTHGERHGFYCTMCDALRPGSGVEEGDVLDPTNHEGEGVIDVDAVEGTCIVEGVTAGTKCKGCGEVLDGCEVTGIVVDNHKNIVDVAAQAPTCTEVGFTEGKRCDDCGEVVEGLEEVQALGHKFGEDNTCDVCGAMTAESPTTGATSEVDGSKKVTFTSNVTVHDKEAEYVEMGILYITASTYAGTPKDDLIASVDPTTGEVTAASPVKAKRYTSAVFGDLSQFTGAIVTINLGATDANVNRTLYARGYVVTKKNGVYTIHFDNAVTSGTYAGGFTTN